jgi:steroid Delta-isomerase
MPTSEQIRATIGQYVECFSTADKDGWIQLFSADARVEDPVGEDAHVGADAIAAFWDVSRTLADAITLVPTGPVRVAGVEAAFPMKAVTSIGDDKLVVDIIDVMTFDDEARITSNRAFWDPAEIRPYEG